MNMRHLVFLTVFMGGLIAIAQLGSSLRSGSAAPPALDAALTDKFDLLCAGEVFTGNETKEPFHDRFRIDLAQGQWCREKCERIFKIASAEPGYLKLAVAGFHGDGNSLSIDRVSGELSGQFKMGALDSTTFASCKRAPFSDFPKTKF